MPAMCRMRSPKHLKLEKTTGAGAGKGPDSRACARQVLDGKEDTLALAHTHTQATGDQRSLRSFLQPLPPGRLPHAAPHRDDDFQTPPAVHFPDN